MIIHVYPQMLRCQKLLALQVVSSFIFRSTLSVPKSNSKVGNILAKDTTLRINLNITRSHPNLCKHTHSPLPLPKISSPLHFPLLGYHLPPLHKVCARFRRPQALAFVTHNTDTFSPPSGTSPLPLYFSTILIVNDYIELDCISK